MKNSHRISSRVVGLILSFGSLFIGQKILSLIFFCLMISSPLIFLPISILLQKIGKKIAKIVRPFFLYFLYYCVFTPYGLMIQLFIRRPLTKFENSKLSELDFDSQS